MHFSIYFLAVVPFLVSVASQDGAPECLKKIAFGKTCTTAEPSIKYHFDNETGLCMAFGFKGCGGNKNNFEDSGFCSGLCKPTSITGCPVKSQPLKKTDGTVLCNEDTDCKANGYCMRRLAGGGICCRKAVKDKVASDYAPSCGKNRTVVIIRDAAGNDEVLIGKSCDSNFCPKGSKCTMGNYFATCCKKI